MHSAGDAVGSSLFRMLQARGWLSQHLFVSSRDGLRGVFVREGLDAGEVLMKIPDHETLKPDPATLMAMDRYGWPPQLNNSISAQKLVGLAAALILLRADPSVSPLAAWKAELPRECPPSNLFVVDDLDSALFGTAWSGRYAMNVRTGVLESLRGLFPNRSLAERQWAACMAVSRAFEHPTAVTSLVPAADFVNHAPPQSQNVHPHDIDTSGFVGKMIVTFARFCLEKSCFFHIMAQRLGFPASCGDMASRPLRRR